jgi:uncharacterized protein YheU (UPF0270 family)
MMVDSNADEDALLPGQAIAVAHSALSPSALRGVLEAFVLREGTDYGEREYTLEQKIAHVMTQIERGKARIMFDPDSDSVGIVTS